MIEVTPGGRNFRVVIIASGSAYQEAAAFSAATFCHVGHVQVTVLLPNAEEKNEWLERKEAAFGFAVASFPLHLISDRKFTSQLKCQGYLHTLKSAEVGEIILFADADTCCLRRVKLAQTVQRKLLEGKIGLVPDIANNHSRNPEVPWHLPPSEQLTYVNSGVVFASPAALPLFRKFRQLSTQKPFLQGPFNDQKVINYALGKFFPQRLVLMEKKYNSIGGEFPKKTIISHFAGGAGGLENQKRRLRHRAACRFVLSQPSVLERKARD